MIQGNAYILTHDTVPALNGRHSWRGPILQRVGEQLVHLRYLTHDRQIDGPVTNFHHQSSENLRVDLLLSAKAQNLGFLS